jgi:hypothetical protein
MFGVPDTMLYPLGIWICLIMEDDYERVISDTGSLLASS